MIKAVKAIVSTIVGPQPSVVADKNTIKILVVEDDSLVARLWYDVLSTFVCVELASTKVEALREMRRDEKPDILILDWVLQGKLADDLLTTWVREIGGPCCVITGALDTEGRYDLYPRGAWNTFEKPLGIAVVTSVVRNYQQFVLMQKERQFYMEQILSMRRSMVLLMYIIAASVILNNSEAILQLLNF